MATASRSAVVGVELAKLRGAKEATICGGEDERRRPGDELAREQHDGIAGCSPQRFQTLPCRWTAYPRLRAGYKQGENATQPEEVIASSGCLLLSVRSGVAVSSA